MLKDEIYLVSFLNKAIDLAVQTIGFDQFEFISCDEEHKKFIVNYLKANAPHLKYIFKDSIN